MEVCPGQNNAFIFLTFISWVLVIDTVYLLSMECVHSRNRQPLISWSCKTIGKTNMAASQ